MKRLQADVQFWEFRDQVGIVWSSWVTVGMPTWDIDTDTPCKCKTQDQDSSSSLPTLQFYYLLVSGSWTKASCATRYIHISCVLYVHMYIRSMPLPARRSWQRIAIWCFYLVQSKTMKNHQNSKSERNFRKQFNPTSQLCMEKLLAWKPCRGNLWAKSFSALEFKVFHYGRFFSGQHVC